MNPCAFFQQRIVGQNCVVSDPLYGYSFDFNKLRKADANYLVTSGEYAYELNVCGPLVKSSKCTDSSIASCQTKPADSNFHFDAGMFNDDCNVLGDGILKRKRNMGSKVKKNAF